MHYHPFRDQLWLPLILSILTALFQIPISLLSGAVTGG